MEVWFSPLLPFGQIGRGADNSDMLRGLLLLRNTGNELPVPPIPGHVSGTREILPTFAADPQRVTASDITSKSTLYRYPNLQVILVLWVRQNGSLA